MDEKDRQEFKNKNPDQWVDLDGDGILEFDPDMPPYPNYKFFTETKWESDTEGGYIGIMYVPGNGHIDNLFLGPCSNLRELGVPFDFFLPPL